MKNGTSYSIFHALKYVFGLNIGDGTDYMSLTDVLG
jgi:hypothetical protein